MNGHSSVYVHTQSEIINVNNNNNFQKNELKILKCEFGIESNYKTLRVTMN